MLGVEGRDGLKTAVGGPDAAAGDGVDMGVKIQAVSVTLDGEDHARPGGRIDGNFPEHLLERLPGRLAEQAEILGVEPEDGAREFGDGEDGLQRLWAITRFSMPLSG